MAVDGNFEVTNFFAEVYAVVSEIPEGKVATYGQIARIAHRPRHARQVGYALAAMPDDHDVPWHRVVNARGEISSRTKPGYDEYQRLLLEEEGIEFDLRGRIDLKKAQWDC